MLGHKIYQILRGRSLRTFGTIRAYPPGDAAHSVLSDGQIFTGIDATDFRGLETLVERVKPDVLVNCIGIIKQRAEAKAAIPSIERNALLPHRLAALVDRWQGRLIHFSTDCVFSGKRGSYTEDDTADAEDLYGRSKYLGEVGHLSGVLTLRTSMIGREVTGSKRGLLEWFLSRNHSTVQGFRRVMYSGVTTNYLADLVAELICDRVQFAGVFQVASASISKYALLCLLRDAYGVDIDIEPVDGEVCDRTMRSDKFVQETGYTCPEWSVLVDQLVGDPTPYPSFQSSSRAEDVSAANS